MKLLKTGKIRGRWRDLAAFLLSGAMAVANAGEPSITVNSAAQRWPWNNKIDVTYTVSNGQSRASGLYCGVEFTITDGGRSHVLHGYTVGASAEGDADGTTHSVVFTAPSGIRSANCTISATLFTTNVPSGNDYMIVNLASGEIYYEGLMDTQDASNARYNVAEYKEGKMVLRKVPKWADRASLPNAAALASLGGYPTGDNVNFAATNSRKDWPTAKDYYIGVFMVTQAQYVNMGLNNPSAMKAAKTGDVPAHRPVDTVAFYQLGGYSYIRDNSPAVPITPSSNGTFLQRLNHKTKLYFDLPTEVMFEIAQRAGATTVYPWGDSYDALPNYCICSASNGGGTQNGGNATSAVGSALPNDWGIYDMTGNVWEWCLDQDSVRAGDPSYNMSSVSDAFTPHVTAATDGNHLARGWSIATVAPNDVGFRASFRYAAANGAGWNRGFRVSHVVED